MVSFLFALVAWSVLLILPLTGIGIIIYQIFTYLRNGYWVSFSLIDGFKSLSGGLQSWAENPHDWIGVHRVADFIPLSVSLILIGILVGRWLLSEVELFIDKGHG